MNTTPARRKRSRPPHAARALAGTRRHAAAARARLARLTALACAWLHGRLPLGLPAVEVLLTDARRRKVLGSAVRQAVRQLSRSVGRLPEVSSIVVAEHVASSGRHLAGAAHVRQDGDGRRRALIRLALDVDGRALRDDEVLAVLAEQWIALAAQQGAPSVLVPVELAGAPERPRGDESLSPRAAARDHDPLAPLGPVLPARPTVAPVNGHTVAPPYRHDAG